MDLRELKRLSRIVVELAAYTGGSTPVFKAAMAVARYLGAYDLTLTLPEGRTMDMVELRRLVDEVFDGAKHDSGVDIHSKLWRSVKSLREFVNVNTESVTGLLDPAELKPYVAAPTLDEVLSILRSHCSSVTLDFAADD